MQKYKVVKLKHNIEIKDIMKTLSNGKKVFDFKKIEDIFSDFSTFIISSERGSLGKTQGLKSKALTEFIENGTPSLFIKNTVKNIEVEVPRFLGNSTIKADTRFADCEIAGSIKQLTGTCLYKKKPYMAFMSLNDAGSIKGSRIIYKNIIYDEINESQNRVLGNISEKISSILGSTEDQVNDYKQKDYTKFWCLANMKSINHPFIIGMGIREFLDTIACYYIIVNNKYIPLCVAIRSQFTKQEKETYIKEHIQTNWRLAINLATNQAEHTNFNETLVNEAHGVVFIPREKLSPHISLRCGNIFLNIFKVHNKVLYYVVKGAELNHVAECFILNKKHSIENVKYHTQLRDKLLNLLYRNKIVFQSMVARVEFLNMLEIK